MVRLSAHARSCKSAQLCFVAEGVDVGVRGQWLVVVTIKQNKTSWSKATKMNELATRDCVPCRGGVPPLKGEELAKLSTQLEGWEVVNDHHIRKEFRFADFKETQAFVNKVGDLAEQQWHHPDVCFGWGRAEITIWTHKIDGLTESDFILAAKIDALITS